jgi:hypothetical protein
MVNFSGQFKLASRANVKFETLHSIQDPSACLYFPVPLIMEVAVFGNFYP